MAMVMEVQYSELHISSEPRDACFCVGNNCLRWFMMVDDTPGQDAGTMYDVMVSLI